MNIIGKGSGMNTAQNYDLDALGNRLKVGDRVLCTQMVGTNAFFIYATILEIKPEDHSTDSYVGIDDWSSNIKILKDGSNKAGWNMRQKMIKI
jgi:hypothetical protein